MIFAVLFGTIIFCDAEERREEKLSPILEKGIGQYKHENFDEAITTLQEARKEDPQSTLAAYYLGLAYKQTQDYKEAVPNLRDAVSYSPKIKGALMELIDCLYQTGKLDEARQWIVEAEKEGIRPAQVAFLKGLVLLKDNDADGAVESFQNAKFLDQTMKQACDYQIGIANLKAKKFSQAKNAFKEVILVSPQSNMASYANEYMDAIEKRQYASRPLKMSVGFAFQYDDNVLLKPDNDTSLATTISDKADWRTVTTGSAEYEYKLNESFGLRGQYFIYWAKQFDLGFYDTLSHTVVGQPTYYFKDGLIAAPVGWNYVYVNDKRYMSAISTSVLGNKMIGQNNMGQAFFKFQDKDYLWPTNLQDEDRTGYDCSGGGGWYYFFMKNRGFFNLRYTYNQETTKGSNWDYYGNRATAALLFPVMMDKVNVTFTGDLFSQQFRNVNSIYNVQRKDTVLTGAILAAYKFYQDSEIQLQYTYIKDFSNISVYEYTRGILSMGMEFKF